LTKNKFWRNCQSAAAHYSTGAHPAKFHVCGSAGVAYFFTGRQSRPRCCVTSAAGNREQRATLEKSAPAIDNATKKREIELVMRQPQRAAQKKLDYPEETPGSRLAAKARKLASKLTPEQRREHFNGAMTMIYGGAKEATLARR
jgi:hypothetical protein